MTKDVTVRLVELLDAIDDAVERGAPQLGGFDFSALSVAHEEIIRLRSAAEPPADRKSALDEIVRISEEAGLYEGPRVEPFYVKHYVGQAHPSIKGNGFDGLTIGDEREEAQEFVDWVNSKIGVEAEKEPDEPAICEKCSQGLSTHHLIIDGAGNAAALCPVVTPPPNRGGGA